MKTITNLVVVAITTLLISPFLTSLQAQQVEVFEEWSSPGGVQEFFYKNVTKTDAARNVYVAGATLNSSGDYDLLITKYNQRGEQLWTNTIAGSGGGHDFATDLDFDHSGNVVVGGSISETSGEGNNILVAKYNPSGTELWQYSHDYSGNVEGAASLAIDNDNSIYLTGATQQPSGYTDMITIKIDSTSALQWEKVLDYNGLHDAGVRIEWTGARVIVTGGGQLNSITYKIWTIGYDPSDGSVLGTMTSGGSSPVVEEVTDLVTDQNDNIYIAGSTINSLTGNDMLLIKLDEDLNIEWTKEWDGDGMSDKGSGVRVAPNGDVYLCGTTETTSGDDIALIKFNADGDFIWEEIYSSAEGGDDVAAAMEWHDDGYLYITGNTYNISSIDYLILKYDSTGTKLWEITYNSPFNKDDRATNLVIDDNGDIVVSGQCETDVEGRTTYYTVKYVEKSIDESILGHIGKRTQGFMKQMGQLNRTDSVIAHEVKYYNDRMKHNFYAQDKGLSYVVTSADSTMNFLETDTFPVVDVDVQRIDLEFLNCNTSCRARAFKPLDYYSNHYFPHCAPGVVRIPHLENLYYESIWAGIDLYLSASKKAEYTFRLYVGAKPKDIKFNAVGADSVILIDAGSKIALTSELNNVEIGDFKAFQVDINGDLQALLWQPKFEINGSVISFYDFGSYNTNIPLVISNVANTSSLQTEGLCWSTFLGGSGNDYPTASSVQNDEFAIAGW